MDALIKKLQDEQIYIGTSSWKYEGWKGLIYKETYKSEKSFNDNCLSEYAKNYSCVGVDHTFYAWPSPTTFEKYISQVPENFRFVLKATEKVSIFQYPKIKRYGKDAGTTNHSFLNADLFANYFLEPLRKFKSYLGPIMFEFSHFYPGQIETGAAFVKLLDAFLAEVTKDKDFTFGVEMRNQSWLKPLYFETLVKHNVAHVFNSWTKMPPLDEQLASSENYVLPAYISRLLLNPGHKYAEAVEAYAPYDKTQVEHPELRAAATKILLKGHQLKKPTYLLVNNRFEGCAPNTIAGILEAFQKKG